MPDAGQCPRLPNDRAAAVAAVENICAGGAERGQASKGAVAGCQEEDARAEIGQTAAAGTVRDYVRDKVCSCSAEMKIATSQIHRNKDELSPGIGVGKGLVCAQYDRGGKDVVTRSVGGVNAVGEDKADR